LNAFNDCSVLDVNYLHDMSRK